MARNETDRLAALDRYGILDTPPERGFDDLTQLAADICNAPLGLITFVDDHRQFFKARVGSEGAANSPLDVGFCPVVVREGTPVIIPDTAADSEHRDNLAVFEGKVRFYAGVPLLTADNQTLGTLCVLDTAPRPKGLTAKQRRALEAISRQVMALLDLRLESAVQTRMHDASRAREAQITEISQRTQNALSAGAITGTWNWSFNEDFFTFDEGFALAFGHPLSSAQTGLPIDQVLVNVHPEDRPGLDAAIADTIARGGSYARQYRVRRADGKYYWLEANGRIDTDATGTATSFPGFIIDIDERRSVEAERDRFTAELRTLRDALERQIGVAKADAERVQLALSAGAIIGTWFWDMPTDRFTVDGAFANAFGLDPALGREGIPLAQIVATVHPDDQAGLADAIGAAIQRGGHYAHQYRTRRADGRYHWLEANGHVEQAPDGTPLRFPGVLLDIATRRYDAAFGELSERLRTLTTAEAMAEAAAKTVGETLDLSRVAYGDVDLAGEWIVVGPNWLADGQQSIAGAIEFSKFGSFIDDLRRGADVLISDVDTDVRTAAHADNFKPIDISSLLNLPLMEHGQLKVVFCLNQSRPHAWSADEVNFARRVMDRTEVEIARLKAETNLLALNHSLEQQVEERTQERNKVWQTSRDMLLVSDEAGVWLSVNPAWTETLGWSPEELIGRTSEWLEHPDDRAKTRAEIGKLAEGATTLKFENRFRTRKGDYRALVWSAVPEDGRFYCVARDVTAEREKAAALLHAEDALRQSQKMEAVGQLTGGVAHDFNNLLTVIRSSSDLLKRPDLSEERRARYIAAIGDTVDRAAKLTGQLLAFARRQALKPEVFDVANSVRGLTDMMGTLTGSRVQVTTELPDAPCHINADPSQFDTALVNLAVNARDAMDGAGEIVIRVEMLESMPAIRTHPAVEAPYVAVSLSDTGSGIEAEVLERIFEPFFTTKEVGKGTGLGLSQVFGFAKQSGGDVTVESTRGKGTTFTLYLPYAAAPTDDKTAEPLPTLVDGEGLRILVVEDNADVGTFTMQTLGDLGYVTLLATDGAAALAELAKDAGRFDVVFSDVVMPGMSGIELGQEIRKLYRDLPVVLTSGYSHVLAENGTFGFELLHKPYSVEQLSQILRKAATWRHRLRTAR